MLWSRPLIVAGEVCSVSVRMVPPWCMRQISIRLSVASHRTLTEVLSRSYKFRLWATQGSTQRFSR